ncbi:MAG: EamA family transporter [Gemmatimonas sp.]|nr:EamA family transporter [Gemmatimonas sp.]
MLRHPDRTRGIMLALVAAVCFGGYFVAMDAVAESDLLWVLFIARTATMAVLLSVVVWTRPPLSSASGAVPGLVGIGIFDLAGSAAFLVAASEGLLSLVSVLGSLYAVVTILLARFILKERINHWQRTGVACAMAGVAMIALGA